MVGDVVLTPFPYTDLSDVKIRPALVVADVGMGDWIVCEITTSTVRRPGTIAISQQDMQSGTLRFASWVRPDRIYTLNQRLFRQTVGRLAEAKQAEISAALRNLL